MKKREKEEKKREKRGKENTQIFFSSYSLDVLKKSLRNIYFVRERVVKGHEQALNNEYMQAIKRCSNDSDVIIFKQWAKFVQLYSKYITEFPEFAHNMALNQSPTSAVAIDTRDLPMPESVANSYPLFWTNNPSAEDPMEVITTSFVKKICLF